MFTCAKQLITAYGTDAIYILMQNCTVNLNMQTVLHSVVSVNL